MVHKNEIRVLFKKNLKKTVKSKEKKLRFPPVVPKVSKAFVWPDNVKIRKGHPTNAIIREVL